MPVRRCVFFALALSAVGFVLRLMQHKTGFEPETGLAVAGNPFAVALAVLLAAGGVMLALSLRSALAAAGEFAEVFSMGKRRGAKTAAVAGLMALAVSGGVGIFASINMTRDILGLAAGAFLVVSALCLFATVKALSAGENGEGVYLLAAVCCAVVQLVASYRLYAVDPVLQSYYVELLALVAHVLAFYTLSGIFYEGRGLRRFTFFALMALILSVVSLADGHGLREKLMLLGMSAVELGFLRAAHEEPRGKRQKE